MTDTTTPSPTISPPTIPPVTPATSSPTPSGPNIWRPKRVSEIKKEFLRCLIYGRPGAGKTSCAATAPGPVLFLDSDDGLSAIRRIRPETAREIGFNPEELYAESFVTHLQLMTLLNRVKQGLQAQPGCWGTIALDSISRYQDNCLSELKRTRDPNKKVDTRKEYGTLAEWGKEMVDFLCKLPVNVVFIAHETEKEIEVPSVVQGKESTFYTKIDPRIIGSLAEVLPQYTDLMGRMETRQKQDGQVVKTTRMLRTREQLIPNVIAAKSRENLLDDYERPNLTEMIRKINAI